MNRTNRIFKVISVILMTLMFSFVSCSSDSSDDDDDSQTADENTSQQDFLANSKWDYEYDFQGYKKYLWLVFDGEGNVTWIGFSPHKYSLTNTKDSISISASTGVFSFSFAIKNSSPNSGVLYTTYPTAYTRNLVRCNDKTDHYSWGTDY